MSDPVIDIALWGTGGGGGNSQAHTHPCPNCYRNIPCDDRRCTVDSDAEGNYTGAHNVCDECEKGRADLRSCRAASIVDAIISDLTDRRGLKQEWHAIDAATQGIIRRQWIDIAKGRL